VEIVESNGTGEILWDKTINETFSLLLNNHPYYVDLQTQKRVTNDYDYFKRLHECILTKASNDMKDAGLLDLFEITEIDLTDEELEDFGEKGYILSCIEKELNKQYNTRKQLVLKTIYAFIDHSGRLNDIDCLSMFGTNSFNLVWESVCAEIMNNQLYKQLGTIQLPYPLKSEYSKDSKLMDLIEKPYWSETGKTANDTLVPDLVTITGNQFIIFDAKYYNVKLVYGKTPKGQPGIESVTKQYLYQLAFQRFIEDHGFIAKNCFLMPTEKNEIEDKGEVSMVMLSNLGLKSIKVRFIPAIMAYELYLTGRRMDILKLGL
jgi:hypothetical protein